MKLVLSKDVKGISKDKVERRHAKAGDVLTVLLIHKNYYICDSKSYPNEHIVVFNNQAAEIKKEYDIPDNNEGITDESDIYENDEINEYN